VSTFQDARFDGFAFDVEAELGELSNRRFKAIVMVALIEHLIDPMQAIRNLRSILADDGFIYIDTPNLAKYTRRLKLLFGRFPSTASSDEGLKTYDGKPVDLYDEGHLHYFTFRSLSEMLKRYCNLTRIEKAPYWSGPRIPRRAGHAVALAWPEMFSDVAVIARP
jgi:SAM-dependent methyltransferase